MTRSRIALLVDTLRWQLQGQGGMHWLSETTSHKIAQFNQAELAALASLVQEL